MGRKLIERTDGCRYKKDNSSIRDAIPIFATVEEKSAQPDTNWMLRCFDLARRGIGYVSPNPPVGAVLIYEGKILSEGYHSYFGGPHAEVEAIKNVTLEDRHLISASTLYISLEPCCITGKTPPCTDLIIREGIRDVRISARDPNPRIAGSGIGMLRSNGIHVTEGILEEEGTELIRSFSINILQQRPQILLKWAQSLLGYSGKHGEQVWLSDPSTRIWSHGQRAKVDAVLVGARTVETDNPSLTVRDFPGRSPHCVVYDPNGRLDGHYAVFEAAERKVYYFALRLNPKISGDHIVQFQISDVAEPLEKMLKILYKENVGILLVEGGAFLQGLFVAQNIWDEAWVIMTHHPLAKGIRAPEVSGRLIEKSIQQTDTIIGIRNDKNSSI